MLYVKVDPHIDDRRTTVCKDKNNGVDLKVFGSSPLMCPSVLF